MPMIATLLEALLLCKHSVSSQVLGITVGTSDITAEHPPAIRPPKLYNTSDAGAATLGI
jgi:hypothetical protein